MLLNEFLKEHRKVEQEEAKLSEQETEIQTLAAMVKEEAAQISKVTAQLEARSKLGTDHAGYRLVHRPAAGTATLFKIL